MARPLCDTPLVLVVRRKMEGEEEEEEEESGLMEVLFLCVYFWSGVCTTTSIVFIIVLGWAGLPLLGIDSVANFLLS
jgi:hypothetical protein